MFQKIDKSNFRDGLFVNLCQQQSYKLSHFLQKKANFLKMIQNGTNCAHGLNYKKFFFRLTF